MKIRKKERKKTFLLFCRTMAENSHLFAFNPSQRMICCRFDVFLFFTLIFCTANSPSSKEVEEKSLKTDFKLKFW